MAFYNYPQRKNNSKFTGMGVVPHDYVTYTYDVNDNVTDIRYYLGGEQAGGTLVGHIQYTYDVNGNIATAERVA